jgi:hypothetical protein
MEKKENVPAFLEPLSCRTTLELLTPNYLSFVLGVAAPPWGSDGEVIVREGTPGNPSVQ